MPTLYYSPRACSMASHVALEEAGATFTAKKVDLAAGEHLKPDYRAINPRARVPALRLDDGEVLVETVAILGWIGEAFPKMCLLGEGPLDRACTIATCAWLSGTVHPTFKQFVRTEQVTERADCHAGVRARARDVYWDHLREIDARLASRPWMMGDSFTVADPYALVFYPWGDELGLPIGELENLASMKDRLIRRPAARRALEREESVLLSM